jgi:quinol monooxygenase YgiN
MFLQTNTRYVKYNHAHSKPGKLQENKQKLEKFMETLPGKIQGINGYTIMDKMADPDELVVLTYWDSKQDMDAFYSPPHKMLAEFVAKLNETLDKPPERLDYEVIKFKLNN